MAVYILICIIPYHDKILLIFFTRSSFTVSKLQIGSYLSTQVTKSVCSNIKIYVILGSIWCHNHNHNLFHLFIVGVFVVNNN